MRQGQIIANPHHHQQKAAQRGPAKSMAKAQGRRGSNGEIAQQKGNGDCRSDDEYLPDDELAARLLDQRITQRQGENGKYDRPDSQWDTITVRGGGVGSRFHNILRGGACKAVKARYMTLTPSRSKDEPRRLRRRLDIKKAPRSGRPLT